MNNSSRKFLHTLASSRYVPEEAQLVEGDLEHYAEVQTAVDEALKESDLTFRVTYDNGEIVTVVAPDKFRASAEADEVIVTRGFDLDDLMFSPKVEVV